MVIDDICAAVKSSLHYLKKAKVGSKTDHSYVEQFQANIKDTLNKYLNGYTWEIEKTAKGRSEKDSIDILGRSKNNPNWIIEIDATRSDQISQKFISRLALWGLDAPIHYVALLYPYTKGNKSACEKYLRYCSEILREVNKESSLIGIFVDPIIESIEIQQYIVNGKRITDHFDVDGEECNSMIEAAQVAIKMYLKKYPATTYYQLKQYWGRYVEKEVRSRARCINVKTKDGIIVYTYANFRQYGLVSYWQEFEQLCKKKGIIITKLRKYYVGDKDSPQYKYKTGWGEEWRERLSAVKMDIEQDCRPISSTLSRQTIEEYYIRCVRHHKGIIVPYDDSGSTLSYVKQLLGYDNLVKASKISEIRIDSSWPLGDSEDEFHALWDRLLQAAKESNNGLLVLNVSDVRLFGGHNIWCVKQLAKQESDEMSIFRGYVLLILDGLGWDQVREYATRSNQGEYEAMMQFYRRIIFDK